MTNTSEIEIKVAEVVDYLKFQGQFSRALQKVVTRKVTVAAAKKAGISVSDEDLQQAADAFRLAHGLNTAENTEKWLTSNGISEDAFEAHLEANLLIHEFTNQLEKQTDKEKVLAVPVIQDFARKVIYQNWVREQMEE